MRTERSRLSSRAAPVEVGHEMGALRLGAGDFARRDEAAAEEALFVFTVQEDHAHDEVLDLADEELHFRLGGPFGGAERLPVEAVLPEVFERVVETRQE